MGWQGDLPDAALLGAIFLAVVSMAELWMRLRRPNPEYTRKLVHLAGGVACLFFPFLITSPWVVLVMALAMSLLFALGAWMGFLKSLHTVDRKTRGSEYYPLAIFLVFLIAHDKPWLYVSSILVLVVSDAFAALIGSAYGRIRYEVEQEKKSLEGSLVFMVLAFLAIHIPTLLMTDYPRSVCVLSSLLVAVLVTGFEAISLRGSDNLFVPIAVCVALGKIIDKPVAEAVYQNVSLLGICFVIVLLAWRVRTFNVGGKIALILFAYGAWALGGWHWGLPVLLGLLGYLVLELIVPTPSGHIPAVRVGIMTRALLPALGLLVFANAYARYDFFYGPYLATCTGVMSFGLWTYLRYLRQPYGWKRYGGAVIMAIFAWCIVSMLPWYFQSVDLKTLVAMGGTVVLISLADEVWTGHKPLPKGVDLWTAEKFLLTCATAGIVSGLQLAGIVSMWNPT